MLRNLLAIVLGLIVALVIVTVGIMLNENWIQYEYKNLPYEKWRQVIKIANKSNKEWLFGVLLISSGIGSLVGGLFTALIVKQAKQAYAIFLGFLLFLIAMLDIIFTPYHPTWYELSITPVLFFFSWLGGLLVYLLYKKK